MNKEVSAMYQKILVPLDGSELAECALPHVKNLVKDRYGKEVIIMTVIWANFPSVGIDPPKYLVDIKSRLHAEGINVKAELLTGKRPAEIISDYVRKNAIDLIVLASHGYTGLKKMMFGSVALEVLHDAAVPVLLIRPESCSI